MLGFDATRGYAFSSNESEKREKVRNRFQELNKKYHIGKINSFQFEKMTTDELKREAKKFDIFISREPRYHHSIHTLVKNETELNHEDILIICDDGNLCFGGSYKGNNQYRVSED